MTLFDHIMTLILCDCKLLIYKSINTLTNLVFIEFRELGRSMNVERIKGDTVCLVRG